MTQVEKKARPYRPLYKIALSENSSQSEKSTLGLHECAGHSLWHLVNVGFIPWPKPVIIPLTKTPPFTPIMHHYSRLTHIPLLQAFFYRLNLLFPRSPNRSIPNTHAPSA